jgi:REP element-mobilizing transposase RayT
MPIFEDDRDRGIFLELLDEVVESFNLKCYAYCLMTNHYHLLIETIEANLSKSMRELNGVYTQRFNRRHNRVGHIFQGRYKSILVSKESHLLQLCRYVVLNPIRAGLVKKIKDYQWSSFGAMVGLNPVPNFLDTDWGLSQFHRDRDEAQKAYQKFVESGIKEPSPWKGLKGGCLLGDEKFTLKFKPILKEKEKVKEIIKVNRLALRPDLGELFNPLENSKKELSKKIIIAHQKHGYTFSEIARFLGKHYSTISKIVKVDRM